ncbi:MAG: DUF6491 family protein [Sphingobium sp.]
MREKATYILALLAAGFTFAIAGGIHATGTAVRAEKPAILAAERRLGIEASIPFVDSGSIRDWRAEGTNAIHVQDVHGHWYRATLIGPCIELPTAQTVAFVTRGVGTLDKFGQVAVRGNTCQFTSLVTSAGPPAKKKADAPSKG